MTDPFTIPAEEVRFRLNRLMGWIKIVSAACDMSTAALESGATSEQIGTEREIDDNAMRLVRAEIRKRGLHEKIGALLFIYVVCDGDESLMYGRMPSIQCDLLDVFELSHAPTELQARCALKVLEEGEK